MSIACACCSCMLHPDHTPNNGSWRQMLQRACTGIGPAQQGLRDSSLRGSQPPAAMDVPVLQQRAEVTIEVHGLPSTSGSAQLVSEGSNCNEKVKANSAGISQHFYEYFAKWRGIPGKKPPLRSKCFPDTLVTFVGAILGMLSVAACHYAWPAVSDAGAVMLIGSFGATAVLLYASPAAPLAPVRQAFLYILALLSSPFACIRTHEREPHSSCSHVMCCVAMFSALL